MPSGDVGLLRVARELDAAVVDNSDQKTGVAIVVAARQIAENAGAEGSIIVGRLREKPEFGYGWNAQTSEFRDLFSQGVIDPAGFLQS